eukprot:7389124-Prymnesium_polylepis.1
MEARMLKLGECPAARQMTRGWLWYRWATPSASETALKVQHLDAVLRVKPQGLVTRLHGFNATANAQKNIVLPVGKRLQ